MARSDWHRPAVSPPEDGFKRVKMVLAYDGRAFNGWQCQDNGIGVQDLVSKAVSKVYGHPVRIQGSGRTDQGVHALGQCAHADVPINGSRIPDERLALALNTMLPNSVRVLSSGPAGPGFHARFSTMAREYWYYIKAAGDALPFDDGLVSTYKTLPPVELLDGYAALIQGTHDFTTFACARDESPSKVRDIYESSWSVGADMHGHPVYRYKVVGNAFLYHQVRSMVGTMVLLGAKGAPVSEFKRCLEAKDRRLALTTAPSAGLYLARVSYDPDEYLWFEEEADDGT